MKAEGGARGPAPLEDVLQAELAEILQARQMRASENQGLRRTPEASPEAPVPGIDLSKPEWQTSGKHWLNVIDEAHRANLVALAFSGGGIRSATFNLGVLQALAELRLLSRVDYLSTVSGGGYIGGWLAAWTKRLGSFTEAQIRLATFTEAQPRLHSFSEAQIRLRQEGFADVQNQLATNRVHQIEDNEPRQIRFLRVFSNYLTPKLGLTSGDPLAATAIILRNVLLNQVVLLAALALLLMVPRALLILGGWSQKEIATHPEVFVLLVCVLVICAFAVIIRRMIYLDMPHGNELPWIGEEWQVRLFVALPLLVAAVLGAMWEWPGGRPTVRYGVAMLVGFAAYGVIWLVALIVVLANWLLKREISEPEEKGRAVGILLKALICALMAGAFGGGLFAVLSEQTKSWGPTQGLTFGVPLVLGIYLLTVTLYIGLMGRPFHDRWREWWGRLDGWLLLWGGAWLASFWMALCFPGFMSTDFVTKAWGATAANYLTPTSIVGTIGWVITTTVGLLRAKSSESSGKIGQTTWKDWFAKAAPCIFVLGLVCWLSYGIEWGRSHRFLEDTFTNGFMRDAFTTYRLWTALIGSVAVLAVMSWRVDINLFSMHSLYRNRLVRCFLGASNKREPDRFTGFDENDDMPLKDLRAENGYDGPYPVFNASLNLTKGQDLAWQERQAASFVMTPLYCGYDWWLEQQDSPLLQRENELKGGKLKPFGYRPTEDYAYPPPDDGLHLGAAMAISGAAVSPNSGYYTSPSVAFLLTLFNVRLGQWLGNPRHTAKWKRASPRIGFGYLLQELFTGSTDVSDYVNLSDGGHFDNMGLYEMVKRRCGLIIVCDAEEDRNYKYEGLGKAIRMCRIDMGIDIDLDVGGITPQEGKQSKRHFAVGKIHYAGKDLNAPAGTLVYFKASVTGDESIDVQMYQKQNTTFPHESTVDQWFSESQFEAYRKLGYDAIKNSLSPQPNAATDPLRRELHEVFSTFGFDTSLVARS